MTLCIRKEGENMKEWLRFRKKGNELEVLSFFAALCLLFAAILNIILGEGLALYPVGMGGGFIVMGLWFRSVRSRKSQAAKSSQ